MLTIGSNKSIDRIERLIYHNLKYIIQELRHDENQLAKLNDISQHITFITIDHIRQEQLQSKKYLVYVFGKHAVTIKDQFTGRATGISYTWQLPAKQPARVAYHALPLTELIQDTSKLIQALKGIASDVKTFIQENKLDKTGVAI